MTDTGGAIARWQSTVIGLGVIVGLAACGRAADPAPAVGSPAPSPAPPTPSVTALTGLAEQIFPQVVQYGYFVECINFAERGASTPGRSDYSTCPITDRLRARMTQTQAHFCPCEQNPSVDREIRVEPRPGGGLITTSLYAGHVKVELIAVSIGGRLLVDDLPAIG